MPDSSSILERIRAENLAVYEASPSRLKEDVNGEDEVAGNYRGRLIHELLQNADDAMAEVPSHSRRVAFRLTDEALWVGNSGRPLDEADIRGLCGIGASSKSDSRDRRRASIGHKGMGFKSVLEVTGTPEAYSTSCSLRMDATVAIDPIVELFSKLGQPVPQRVPTMRFPFPVAEEPDEWRRARDDGIRTLFRFPLRSSVAKERRHELADRLQSIPVTTVLFLKHLDRVDIEVDASEQEMSKCYSIGRERRGADGWQPCPGLGDSGLYRVTVTDELGTSETFLVAQDIDVEIGDHRGGLQGLAWEGVELSEVSVAVRMEGDRPVSVPLEWRWLHVFLPTAEPCPYPLLVNGAFASDISRRSIAVTTQTDDYNAFLLRRVADVFRRTLVPELLQGGGELVDVLGVLDRGVEPGADCHGHAGQALYEAMRSELSNRPILPVDASGPPRALRDCAVPPLAPEPTLGSSFRELLHHEAAVEDRRLVPAALCAAGPARTLVDHGTHELSAEEAAALLCSDHLSAVSLDIHESGDVMVDPVLTVLERYWTALRPSARSAWVQAVRAHPLFPVDEHEGVVQRVAVRDEPCFYPPRSLRGSVPLRGLRFLLQDVAWGTLTPPQRTITLRRQMTAWHGLFELQEFKFAPVMQRSVLPLLRLDASADRRDELADLNVLAAICQLSGNTPTPPASPLPYERLGATRTLFNLARLPVPCRQDDGIRWEPAYTAYFGRDWIGDASVERVLDAMRAAGNEPPTLPFLVAPDVLVPLLERFRHLRDEQGDTDGMDDDLEVGDDEDEELPVDEDDRERWLHFLSWLGVGRALRPVPFHDVEERSNTWLQTRGLSRPAGRAFASVPDDIWTQYRREVGRAVEPRRPPGAKSYFYRLHELDHGPELLDAAAADAATDRLTVGQALFEHFALNWSTLNKFASCQVAVVPEGKDPGRRTQKRAYEEELARGGDDYWLWRLKQRDFCPTSLGPRAPRRTWLRSDEVVRRFGRRGSDPAQLLPLLEVSMGVPMSEAAAFARRLGARADLTASAFEPADARGLLERLERIWDAVAEDEQAAALRHIVRPAYRNLVELLPGQEDDERPGFEHGVLAGAPLLVTNGRGNYRFDPSDKVLWASRSGTVDRLGRPPELFTFMLEATAAGRAPLTRLLGVRVLEEALEWIPEPADSALDESELSAFRRGLNELVPALRARLAADRADERQVTRDGAQLRGFVEAIEPVTALSVRCTLDGDPLTAVSDRQAFASPGRSRLPMQAFVVWGEQGWPPSAAETEALATALCDALEVNTVEAFIALISAPTTAARERLLGLAGAPTDMATDGGSGLGESEDDMAPAIDAGREHGAVTDEYTPPPSSDGEGNGNGSGGPGHSVRRTLLYRQDQLLIDGVPVEIEGRESAGDERPPGGQTDNSEAGNGMGGGGAYGGHTDLGELNRLGMHVALAFEQKRLRDGGHEQATIFDGQRGDSLVFDVSTLEAIDAARRVSPAFQEALTELTDVGIDPQVPGFDILSLAPGGRVDRLIELKSSGTRARTQELSFNEWKTARNSTLRTKFFLYLVGNLRSDLPGAEPFLRSIRDPFGTLWAEERDERATRKRIRLDLEGFATAQELQLGVRGEQVTGLTKSGRGGS